MAWLVLGACRFEASNSPGIWTVAPTLLDSPIPALHFPLNMPALPTDMATPHAPAQSWSLRVPSPPRIIVPPPALNSFGVPDLHVVQNASYDFESSGFKNAEFLQTVTYGNFMTINSESVFHIFLNLKLKQY